MGKTYKQSPNFKRSRDFKKADKLKNRQIDQQINRDAYNKDREDDVGYDDYSEDLNFEKFSKPYGKR